MTQQPYVSITDSLRLSLCQALDDLLAQALSDEHPIAGIEQIGRMLEALPLGNAEFSLAVNRLANAQHYLQSGEPGAARYELHLLRQSLR
jgi:hypothetical protein